MASETWEHSLLGNFIIAPSRSTSPANRTSSAAAVYGVRDEDQLSPPRYPLKSFPSAGTTVQATITTDTSSLGPQANGLTDLSAQTTTLKIKDLDKDKTAESHDMRASTETNYQTAPAQTTCNLLDSTPDTLNINGVQYVKEQPNMPLPAMINVLGPSQIKESGQSIHNTRDSTAGHPPISDLAGLGNSTHTAVAPVNLQDHEAQYLTQHHHRQGTDGRPKVARLTSSIPVVPSRADTTQPEIYSIDQNNSYYDEMSSPTIKVMLDDGNAFFLQKDILRSFFGKFAERFQSLLSKHCISLADVSAWVFSYLVRCIYGRKWESPATLQLSKFPNDKLVELYLTAKRFGQDWLLVPCMQAIDPNVSFRKYVNDLKGVYDRGEADDTFRAYFKRGFGACMLLHNLPLSIPPHHSELVTTMLEVGGTIASDIKLALMDKDTPGAEPKPSIAWGNDIDYEASSDRSKNYETATLCRHCGGLPGGEDDSVGPCNCGDCYQPTSALKKASGLSKSGGMETALSTESAADAQGDGGHRSHTDWEGPVRTRQTSSPGGDVQRASQQLHNFIDHTELYYRDNWRGDGFPASSEREEIASGSAIANDGWTVNQRVRDGRWDAPTVGQLTPVDNATAWAAEPRQLAPISQHVPERSHESAFYPRRQLQSPAVSFSSAMTPPPRGRAPSNLAPAILPAQYPDLPFNAPHPSGLRSSAPYTYHVPPHGMPNYVHPFGYARQAHVGNGIMHSTAPGLYGLAGRTMVAISPSEGLSSRLYFQAGDHITNVVRSNTRVGPTSSAYMLQGVCRGRHGIFHGSFVRDLTPPAPIYRRLASPFAPIGVRETRTAAGDNQDTWETTDDKEGRGSTMDKQAHVSDEDMSDDGAGGYGDGPAEPRNDVWGYHAPNDGGFSRDKAPDGGEGDWNPAPAHGW